ncbi:nitrous oxide-stimulated promoter family protein [Endozoicomonas sp. YOMI1]|uniref:nitrous oxide-stimulated promoter family protein n=1 Tax=Endozoicomonas sp. YOMI1 TaxID=2828739 RepID=UPI0035A131F6
MYGVEKPTCANCQVHCYKPEQRRQIREVMKWAGPRLLLKHPVLTIQHLIDECRAAPVHPKAGRH